MTNPNSTRPESLKSKLTNEEKNALFFALDPVDRKEEVAEEALLKLLFKEFTPKSGVYLVGREPGVFPASSYGREVDPEKHCIGCACGIAAVSVLERFNSGTAPVKPLMLRVFSSLELVHIETAFEGFLVDDEGEDDVMGLSQLGRDYMESFGDEDGDNVDEVSLLASIYYTVLLNGTFNLRTDDPIPDALNLYAARWVTPKAE